jgi:hypothetical protein
MRDRKKPVLIAVAVCAAVITLIALRSALWSTPPWPHLSAQSEANYPSYFVEARQKLFAWAAPILCLSSAVAGGFLARSFYAGGPYLGRAAAVAMAWPALAFPFVGYIGLFALVFIPLA